VVVVPEVSEDLNPPMSGGRRWTDVPLPDRGHGAGSHDLIQPPERPPKGLRRSDWLNPRVLGATAILAFLVGSGIFVLATALETHETLEDVQTFQVAGRERTYQSQGLSCTILVVLGQELPAGSACHTPEVLAYFDPGAAERGRVRLACTIATLLGNPPTDTCLAVLTDTDAQPSG
jgi:hypothetical protein